MTGNRCLQRHRRLALTRPVGSKPRSRGRLAGCFFRRLWFNVAGQPKRAKKPARPKPRRSAKKPKRNQPKDQQTSQNQTETSKKKHQPLRDCGGGDQLPRCVGPDVAPRRHGGCADPRPGDFSLGPRGLGGGWGWGGGGEGWGAGRWPVKSSNSLQLSARNGNFCVFQKDWPKQKRLT